MFEPHVYGCMNWVSFPMYGRLNLIDAWNNPGPRVGWGCEGKDEQRRDDRGLSSPSIRSEGCHGDPRWIPAVQKSINW